MANTRILLADDEPDILTVFKGLLESAKYQVITAKDGIECIQKAVDEKPDLILLDLVMPNKDGFKTLQALKSNESTMGIPVIMLTASRDIKFMSECTRIGAKDYILKTLPSEEIIKYVKRCVPPRDPYEKVGQLTPDRNKRLFNFFRK